ncbi:MAG: SDR family oxidoreductase, partial [Pyramidobacter sp.]|nr:SDR family oxidoreductase [Pyramidobacter sp.]
FHAVINVNLGGNFNMTKAVVPYMMEQRYGKIVHCASVSAFNGNFGQSNYAASKAAIMGMARVQGKELGKYGINVNAVCPGSIMTDMYAAVPEEVKEKKLKSIPLRRYGDPRECAQVYCFLASDEASYITAQTVVCDGGFN